MAKKDTGGKPEAGSGYKFMALGFKLRDFFKPRGNILKEIGLKPGDSVLDYGCGPGGYILPTLKLVGKTGKLYALDVNPIAIDSVQKIVNRNNLANVRTIISDCATGLPPQSIDIILLYDILHHLKNRVPILEELNRVLKNEGTLSVSDHHLDKDVIIAGVTEGGFFKVKPDSIKTISFVKNR